MFLGILQNTAIATYFGLLRLVQASVIFWANGFGFIASTMIKTIGAAAAATSNKQPYQRQRFWSYPSCVSSHAIR